MSSFKVGDRVRRTAVSHSKVFTGGIYTIASIKSSDLSFVEVSGQYWAPAFELVAEAPSVSSEQQARRDAADKLRATRDAFNEALADAKTLGLSVRYGLTPVMRDMVISSITYEQVIKEEL